MNKRTIATLFLFAFVISTAVFAQNASDFRINQQGIITKYDGWDTVIVIPSQINGITVTGIGNSAFSNMGITSVTIPASVRSIGEEAFAANKLTTVTIPAGASVGEEAFRGNNLTNIVLGADILLSMDALQRPFSYSVYYDYMCNGRRAGTYNATVNYTAKRAGDYEYYETRYGAVICNYHGLESNRLQIPQTLGGVTVKGITGRFTVSRVQIPDGITFIGGFSGGNLTSVTIPESVIAILPRAFTSNQLDSITIPNNVAVIGRQAFSGNALKSITLPNSLRLIGVEAFNGNNINSVTIGAGVEFEYTSSPSGIGLDFFERSYISGGRTTGTYILNKTVYPYNWSKQ